MLLVVEEPAALCEFRVRGGDDHVLVSNVAGDLKEPELGYGVHIRWFIGLLKLLLCCQKVLTGLGSDDFGPAGDSEAFEELTGVLAGLFDLGDLLGSDRAEVRMGGHVGYVVGG